MAFALKSTRPVLRMTARFLKPKFSHICIVMPTECWRQTDGANPMANTRCLSWSSIFPFVVSVSFSKAAQNYDLWI